MKLIKKLVFIPLFGLILTGCNLVATSGTSNTTQDPNTSQTPGTSVSEVSVTPTVANARVAGAMAKMMLEPIEAVELDIDADVDLNIVEDYIEEDSYDVDQDMTFEATLSASIIAKNIDPTDLDELEVAATAEATLYATNTAFPEEIYDLDMGGAAYVDEGWLYLHLNGDIGLLFNDDELEEIKVKAPLEEVIGPIEEEPEFQIPSMTSEDIELYEDFIKDVLATVDVVTAVDRDGNLTVTYTITEETIVDAFYVIASTFSPDEVPTPSEFEEIREEMLLDMAEVVDIELARLTLGVASDGSMSHFGIELKAELITPMDKEVWNEENQYYEYVDAGDRTITIDGTLAIDMVMNGNPTITFPSDLDTYPYVNEQNEIVQ